MRSRTHIETAAPWRCAFWARLILCAALFAAALRGIAPTGYMVDYDRDAAAFTVVICTGSGPVSVRMDPESGEIDHDDGAPGPIANDKGHCPFAAFGKLFALGEAPGRTPPAFRIVVSEFRAPESAPRREAGDAAPPPSRAPPRAV